MASAKEEQGALTSIGNGIYLCKPVANGGRIPIELQPTIILIFGWMGAKIPHLLKYTQVYDEIYPDAMKVVIRSEASSFWISKQSRIAYLAPAVEVLEASGCLPPSGKTQKLVDGAPSTTPPPRVLVHSFSNGGSWQLVTLSDIFLERFDDANYPQRELPPTAVVFDSCPGTGGLRATQKAFLAAVRHPILRLLVGSLITVLYVLGTIMERIFRVKSKLTVMREHLNRHKLLPWFSKATPRLYIYSKTDELIPFKDIEAHAESARKEGLETRLVRYDDSPHVAHSRSDPTRYWGAIRELWDDVTVKRSH